MSAIEVVNKWRSLIVGAEDVNWTTVSIPSRDLLQILLHIDEQAAAITKLAAWKASVETQEPADVQVRVNNPLCTWQRPDPTRDEPTPLARAQYLCDNWPKTYRMRLLYTLPEPS